MYQIKNIFPFFLNILFPNLLRMLYVCVPVSQRHIHKSVDNTHMCLYAVHIRKHARKEIYASVCVMWCMLFTCNLCTQSTHINSTKFDVFTDTHTQTHKMRTLVTIYACIDLTRTRRTRVYNKITYVHAHSAHTHVCVSLLFPSVCVCVHLYAAAYYLMRARSTEVTAQRA